MRVAGSSRLRSASSVAALVAGGLILALVVIDVPLARLAHQSLNASGGSSLVWYSAALGVVGFVVASRKPGNPLGSRAVSGRRAGRVGRSHRRS